MNIKNFKQNNKFTFWFGLVGLFIAFIDILAFITLPITAIFNLEMLNIVFLVIINAPIIVLFGENLLTVIVAIILYSLLGFLIGYLIDTFIRANTK